MAKTDPQSNVLDILEVKARFILKDDIDIDNRTININSAITTKSYDKLSRSLTFLEGLSLDPITITMNCPGGSVYDGFAMVDRIKFSPCDIHTRATGLVASMAIPVLCSGKVRTASRNAYMMFHEVSYALPFERLTSADIESKHSKHLNQQICRFMAGHTKKDYSYWVKIGKHVDFYFDSNKALELGIIDEIQ